MAGTVEDIITAAATNLGYPTVKEEQGQAITAFVSGKDVFVALPTGYEKSLCYALLPFVFDSLLGRPPSTFIVICISTLVLLMQDQKDQFVIVRSGHRVRWRRSRKQFS